MIPELQKPCLIEDRITVQKGMTFCKSYNITNPIGQGFDFSKEEIVGYFRKDDSCICPKIDFCINLLNNCSTIEMYMDARVTEKLKPRKTYFYYIDLNPRPPIEELDRSVKISEIEDYVAVSDLSIEQYSNYKYLEPLLDHKASHRLVKGTIRVES